MIMNYSGSVNVFKIKALLNKSKKLILGLVAPDTKHLLLLYVKVMHVNWANRQFGGLLACFRC